MTAATVAVPWTLAAVLAVILAPQIAATLNRLQKHAQNRMKPGRTVQFLWSNLSLLPENTTGLTEDAL